MSITQTGSIRAMLTKALEQASKGKLSSTDGKNMIGLANQISKSIAEEIKHANMMIGLGITVEVFGAVETGLPSVAPTSKPKNKTKKKP